MYWSECCTSQLLLAPPQDFMRNYLSLFDRSRKKLQHFLYFNFSESVEKEAKMFWWKVIFFSAIFSFNLSWQSRRTANSISNLVGAFSFLYCMFVTKPSIGFAVQYRYSLVLHTWLTLLYTGRIAGFVIFCCLLSFTFLFF